jgi:N-acetylneuraminic acid mutarotase
MRLQSTARTSLAILSLIVGYPAAAVAAASGTWATTGSMGSPRVGHTATLLNDGNVLVTGGMVGAAGGVGVASAEIFNPATGRWTATGSMSEGRVYHTATLLPGGEVLVAGGLGAGGDAAELFDPATGRWSATAKLNQARYHHAALLLADGQVMVIGGLNSSGADLASAEVFDPSTDTWTAVASMNVARALAAATLLPGGEVLIAGGNEVTSAAGHSAEIFTQGQWRLVASMGAERSGDTAALLGGGEVLVTGGGATASSEVYNPSTGAWENTDGLGAAPPEQGQTETLLPTGMVILVGGVNQDKSTDAVGRLYDPSTNRWDATGSLNHPRSQHTATRLENGQVLVTGGELALTSGGRTTTTVLASAELYTP